MTPMRSEYIRLIAEVDSVLSTIRGLWIDATTLAERERWRTRLDQLLDERLRLMRCRDAFAATAP